MKKHLQMFSGRTLLIATMHQKQKAMSEILEIGLGVKCVVASINTDLLGTFTGETERILSPYNAAIQKCETAMSTYQGDLAVASEGSFGPHPQIPFVKCNDELVVLVDKPNELIIAERETSLDTNFNQSVVNSLTELYDFAKLVGFPDHALILREGPDSILNIHKGINTRAALEKSFADLKAKKGTVYVETDMRAMYNPTRMKVITKAVEKLVAKINSLCPECSWPGFGVKEVKQGLPCELCGMPTYSTLCHISVCKKCGCTNEQLYPHEKKTENPMYCNYCNP